MHIQIKLADFGLTRHFKDEGMKLIDMKSVAGIPIYIWYNNYYSVRLYSPSSPNSFNLQHHMYTLDTQTNLLEIVQCDC